MPTAARIGLFGGTFDPIHVGHIKVADEVRTSLHLDRMLMMVANEPWQKQGARPLTPAEDRFAMVVAATQGCPGLEPSRMELERGGPSFTVDTVDQLLESMPECEVFVVVGGDVVADLPTWRDQARLASEVTLAVVNRPGSTPAPVPPGWRWVRVQVEPVHVSSTDLRARLTAGRAVGDLLPEPVMRCIRQRGLYATGR